MKTIIYELLKANPGKLLVTLFILSVGGCSLMMGTQIFVSTRSNQPVRVYGNLGNRLGSGEHMQANQLPVGTQTPNSASKSEILFSSHFSGE